LHIVAWERRFSPFAGLVDRSISAAEGVATGVIPLGKAHLARAAHRLASGDLFGCRADAERADELLASRPDLRSIALLLAAFTGMIEPTLETLRTFAERSIETAVNAGCVAQAGRSRSLLALARFLTNDLDAAREDLNLALADHRGGRDVVSEAVTRHRLALLERAAGHLGRAELLVSESLATLSRAGYGHHELGLAMLADAGLKQERGNLPAALERFDAAVVWLTELGAFPYLGIALGERALCLHEKGDLGLAERDYEEAIRLCVVVPGHETEYRALLAVLNAQTGRAERAQALLEVCEERTATDGIRHPEEVVDACRWALARFAGREAAGTSLKAKGAVGSGAVRAVQRIVVATRTASISPPASDVKPAEGKLYVAGNAERFRLGLGEWIDLPIESAQQRILAALISAHDSRTPLSLADLGTVGWPGEAMAAKSARNRLHVALSGLRQRGLRPAMKRGPRGYFLDDELEIVTVAA